MKVVILAGGLGTRLSEETKKIPKPMVEIGGKPILWHIMKIFSAQGFNEFVVCLGYKGYLIKEYFSNYFLHNSDVEIDIKNNQMLIHDRHCEPWRVTLIDTGDETQTGGRLKRVQKYLGDETFMFTYGDGVADVDLKKLLAYHKKHGKIATVTAVQPEGRFGSMHVEGDKVTQFAEKHDYKGRWINGGFFVLEPKAIDYIKEDSTRWELEPLERLSKEGNLIAYKHEGFWKAMDKLSDKMELEEMWDTGKAPWMVWKS